MTSDTAASQVQVTHSFAKRSAVLGYGVASYVVGVASLVAWILYMLGVLPFTGLGLGMPLAVAAVFNVALMVAFAVQHSIMARPAFKEKWTQLLPKATVRSSFVLATGVVLLPVLVLWQPMQMVIWDVSMPAVRFALYGVALLAWAYLFAASFAINHFELFGLRQVYEYFRGQEVTSVAFKERWMYRFDRHPIMSGALIGMWVTPTMNLDHLMFAATCSIYIVIGVYFEERALRRDLGDTYDDYRSRVGSIVPTFS